MRAKTNQLELKHARAGDGVNELEMNCAAVAICYSHALLQPCLSFSGS